MGARKGQLAVGAVRRDFAPWADATATPLIEFQNVTKRFGATAAVSDLSLSIYEREFFCLLGPSGCGKTTLMRLLAGLEQPDGGHVLLGGKDQAATPPHLRPVNMMFQSYALFPHMNVEANIGFGLRQEGLPRAEIRTRVAEMLELVQLEGLARRRPDQLSGGQRQRVALARALVKRPKVLLLDEPLGALDKKLREATQFELMDIQMRLGTTFLMVTHDQEEAMAMADRIAVMDRGAIVQLDPPNVIYERPASRYVAQFIGDVNMLDGEVVGGDVDRWTIRCPGIDATLTVEAAEALQPGSAVAVAVRPEKITLSRAPLPGPNAISGTVWDIGYLGDWTTYVVKVSDGHLVRVSQANVRRFVEDPLTWEDTVHVGFAPDAAVVLTR